MVAPVARHGKGVRALVDRPGAGARDLSTMIVGGVIHLEGRVANEGQRLRAEEVARQVSGAQIVADDLQVREE